MEFKNIEEVREFFGKDKFAATSGAYIEEIGHHSSTCSIEVTDMHLNAMGGLMGGVPFVLADFAFAVASNWEKQGTVSLSSNVSFLNAFRGKKLIAVAECVKDGRSTCCYSINLTDENGNAVAVVTIIGFHKA